MSFKGAPKFYFMQYWYVIIIYSGYIFITGLCQSVYFPYSFGKIVFLLSMFSVYSVYFCILSILTVLLNSVQEFIEKEAWLLLTFFICLHNHLSSIHSIVTYQRVHMLEKGNL